MAIHAHSTPAPTVQPRLLRGGGTVPCTVLTDADVVALVALTRETELVLQESKRRSASLTDLPPALLPPISDALARRRQIFGGYNG